MAILKALAGGLVGACVITLVHETARRLDKDAPRMDVLGMRAISKTLGLIGEEPPQDKNKLHDWAMASDIVANTLYYSFAGTGKDALWKGTVLGAAAGAGAVYLPGPMGLGEAPSNRTTKTQVMAIGLYLLGGVVAGSVGCLLGDKAKD